MAVVALVTVVTLVRMASVVALVTVVMLVRMASSKWPRADRIAWIASCKYRAIVSCAWSLWVALCGPHGVDRIQELYLGQRSSLEDLGALTTS